GAGAGAGKILNPKTEVLVKDGSYVELELEQIKGVDSTERVTMIELGNNSEAVVHEKTFSEGRQTVNSTIKTTINGKDSKVDIVSRAVARDISKQKFSSEIIGNSKCRGHSECDAILMDKAQVLAVPSLDARNLDAELIHEAAIGKIAGEQIEKLMTLGLSEEQAVAQIINGFLA
ncbi:SufD family Fe-S cluster assembly protein, partial [Candidatus Saccharibacteria bacterium]|nr:SufD family Fe-S cluster assembly protein [Candidatus Saccharibacteria bacterium]